MTVFDLDSEVFVGDDDEPSIESSQEEANTQDEDQDDDPETTEQEKSRIWRLIGISPHE